MLLNCSYSRVGISCFQCHHSYVLFLKLKIGEPFFSALAPYILGSSLCCDRFNIAPEVEKRVWLIDPARRQSIPLHLYGGITFAAPFPVGDIADYEVNCTTFAHDYCSWSKTSFPEDQNVRRNKCLFLINGGRQRVKAPRT